MTKIAGSGSISQRHGSADQDPDPPQNVMDPQHCLRYGSVRTRNIYLKIDIYVQEKENFYG
jgi:hypothetical protein